MEAKDKRNRVSILVAGTYKPYTGFVRSLNEVMVSLDNEYSNEYIMLADIKALRVYY